MMLFSRLSRARRVSREDGPPPIRSPHSLPAWQMILLVSPRSPRRPYSPCRGSSASYIEAAIYAGLVDGDDDDSAEDERFTAGSRGMMTVFIYSFRAVILVVAPMLLLYSRRLSHDEVIAYRLIKVMNLRI